MRPGPHLPPPAPTTRPPGAIAAVLAGRRPRWSIGGTLLAIALAQAASPALAQEGAAPGVDTAIEAVEVPLPDADRPQSEGFPRIDGDVPGDQPTDAREVDFATNSISYDSTGDIVTLSGDVVLRTGDQSVRADNVIWNRDTGEIVAEGAIRFVDADGNQLFTDRMELTEELAAGAMENLLLVFSTGGRLAAVEAAREEGGDIAVTRASYSTCAVTDGEGCPRTPSWRITAERVTFDAQSRRIRFTGAHLELFGRRVLPLPRLSLRADGGADTGFFVPSIGYSASNGFELSDSYYLRIAEHRDLTLSAYLFTEAAPMASAQYRHLTGNGAFQATGYLTYGTRIPLGSTERTTEEDIRGYIFVNGRFQPTPKWTLEGSLRLASDRTFLRRYDISREDRLRSVVRAERIDFASYLSIAGWATQALLVDTPQGQVPLALPVIDYRRRIEDKLLGGMVELQGNTLAITRREGQNTQRAFARAQWDWRRITGLGQEVTLTGLVRADAYHSSDNLLNPTPSYRGERGWQARGVALAALDVRWPFIGSLLGGTQIVTPRVQLVATPPLENLAIPNEDARAIDLEDSNLFALNRFPGYDRVEEGVRVTYGVDWRVDLPSWRLKATIGQSYRLDDKPTLFPDGTGLTDRFSDYVGRSELRYRDFVRFTHRFRLDKDNFAVRRNEIDAAVGSDRTYLELGYLRLNRDIDPGFEDLQDREELRAAGRWEFTRFWSVFGSAVVNLTDREEDPSLTSDGFEPLRTRLGFAYSDDCLEFGVTWRRDYVELADAERGNSFRLHFALRNLGL